MIILELIGRLIAILGLIFLSVRVIFWKQSVKDKDRYFATLGLYCVYMIFIIAWNS